MSSTLMLNADASPISILPLSIITWEESIRYLVTEKATVIEWYSDWVVHSARWSTRVPAVMILKEYQKKKTGVRFTKGNVFLRDEYRCQYCGTEVNRKTATLDHVLPISHDGKTSWENCTTACGSCNSRKGNNHKIVPRIAPHRPSYFSLIEKRKKMPWDIKHPSWADYLQ
jgi:5-methylcytosine-specific restriction endonuclease McrA